MQNTLDDRELSTCTAAPPDATAIAHVLRDAFAEHQALFVPEDFVKATPAPEDLERRFGEGPIWVASLGREIIGTVSAVLEGSDLYVRSMAVSPNARGRKVGAALLSLAEAYARTHGCSKMSLDTRPFMIPAISVYEQAGFYRSDAPPRCGPPGSGAFAMVKELLGGYTLRWATSGDSPILALHRRRMFEDVGNPDDPLILPVERRSLRWFREAIDRGQCIAWIAEVDGSAVASLAVLLMEWPPIRRDPGLRRAYIFNAYTSPEHRRRGIARQLLRTSLAEIKRLGIRVSTLHASKFGRALYESEGFQPTNEMILYDVEPSITSEQPSSGAILDV
jgi:ribosomal protein S18 acetylase RimI-like enzyme